MSLENHRRKAKRVSQRDEVYERRGKERSQRGEVKRFGTREGLNSLPLALNMEKGLGPMCGL